MPTPLNPLVNNSAGRKLDGTAPMFGPMGTFRVGDLPASYSYDATANRALNAVVAATTSSAIALGAHGIFLSAKFSDGVTRCDLKVYRVDSGPIDTLVATFPGVSNASDNMLFVTPSSTNLNGPVDLKGLPVKVRAESFSGGGSVTVYVRRCA